MQCTTVLFSTALLSLVCNVRIKWRGIWMCVCVLFHVKCHKSFPLWLYFHFSLFSLLTHSLLLKLKFSQTQSFFPTPPFVCISSSSVCANKMYIYNFFRVWNICLAGFGVPWKCIRLLQLCLCLRGVGCGCLCAGVHLLSWRWKLMQFFCIIFVFRISNQLFESISIHKAFLLFLFHFIRLIYL